ncbi:MAG: hypothetical protein AAFO91_20320, partial [Bacteroidota bacterium]
AVKCVKRLMRSNVGPLGTLNTDRFLKAMLQLRNTPDPDCGVSPAEIVFGRPLRDNLLFTEYLSRQRYSKRWQEAWSLKEEALRARFVRTSESLNQKARNLPPLTPGDKCFVQNQTGPHSKKWHHTGTIVEAHPHDKYVIRMDGSGRVTCRNRRFIRKYTPVNLSAPISTRGYLCDRTHKPVLQAPQKQNSDRQCHIDMGPPDSHSTPTQPPTSSTEDIPSIEPEIPEPVPFTSPVARDNSPPVARDNSPPVARDNSPPVARDNSTPSKRSHSHKAKLPLALRRLQDFNSPGLKE